MKTRYIWAILFAIVMFGCTPQGDKNSSESEIEERENKKFNYQYNTLEEAEKKLIEIINNNYDFYREYYELIDFIQKEVRTIDYPFIKLQMETDVNIITSDDGNLKLYYWDNGKGGTMACYSNITQYSSQGKVYTYDKTIDYLINEDDGEDLEEDYGCSTQNIITLKDNNNSPIYLVECYNRISSSWGYSGIYSIKIKDGKIIAIPLFYDAPVFNIEKFKQENDIMEYCYKGFEANIPDWFFKTNYGDGWGWLLSYDRENDILYFPQTDTGYLTDRYTLYHFNGNYFDNYGGDGGFWLHPSLRSFKCLELYLVTKDFRIRVDKMHDGSYRYASWPKKRQMDNAPSLIIYNGRYEDETLHFSNNGYEYFVNFDNGIKVVHKGKTILEQEWIRYEHKY